MAKTAVIFPGQGAQTVGMGKENYERHPAARALYDRARSILDFDLLGVSFEGPKDELDRTDYSQPAIFVASAASRAAYEATGGTLGEPSAVAGLSLGEYTALWFAGVLSFESALALVAARGRFMQEACGRSKSGMSSVLGLDRARAEEVCARARGDDVLVVANVNAPNQIVISGHVPALQRAAPIATELGAAKVVSLAVAGAFHSPVMEPAREALAREIERAEMSPPSVPIVTNVSASGLTSVAEIRDALVRQLTEPVLWSESMAAMIASGIEVFYEIGPGKVLAGLARRIDRAAKVVSIDKVDPAS